MKQIDCGGMDVRVERKSRLPKKVVYGVTGAMSVLVVLSWLVFRDTSSSMHVDKGGLTISTVERGNSTITSGWWGKSFPTISFTWMPWRAGVWRSL